MHDLFLCGYEALPRFLEVPKYGWLCFLVVCEPGPMICLDKKWRSFCVCFSPSWMSGGSSRMRGGSPLMSFSICTRKRSLKNICQELWTPSLGYFSGSSLTCKGLCAHPVFPWLWSFHYSCSWSGLNFCWRWLHSHAHIISQWTAGPSWALEKDVLVVLEVVGMVEPGVLCAWILWFTNLASGWGSDGHLFVCWCMASQGLGNALSFLCLLLG